MHRGGEKDLEAIGRDVNMLRYLKDCKGRDDRRNYFCFCYLFLLW